MGPGTAPGPDLGSPCDVDVLSTLRKGVASNLGRMRSLARILALAAISTMAVPAAASAASARFYATAEGRQAISWDLIDHPTGGDCFHTRTQHGEGGEVYSFKANRTKVRVIGTARSFFVVVGSWSTALNPLQAMTAFSRVARDGEIVNKVTPGPCGGSSSEQNTGPYDCGTHTGREAVNLALDSHRRMLLGLGSHPLAQGPDGFNRCPISAPAEVGTASTFTQIASKPVSGLFNRKRHKIVIKATQSYSGKNGLYDPSSARVEWHLTLTRAK